MEIETSDVYRDLGYLPREEIKKEFIGEFQKSVDKGNQRQMDRRQRNFELVKELCPSIIDEGIGTISLKIIGGQIDFHLPSNTFYTHAKGEYGYGIEQQVGKIKEFLSKHPNPIITQVQ